MRATHPGIAVIVLTARGEVADRVNGLDEGADDYLVRPSRSMSGARVSARFGAAIRVAGTKAPGKLLSRRFHLRNSLKQTALTTQLARDSHEMSRKAQCY